MKEQLSCSNYVLTECFQQKLFGFGYLKMLMARKNTMKCAEFQYLHPAQLSMTNYGRNTTMELTFL